MQGIGSARSVEQGGVLIHIGPHKTGTTAVQDALLRAAPSLAEQGFMYFASGNQINAVLIATSSTTVAPPEIQVTGQ